MVFDLGGVLLDWNPTRIFADTYADPELREAARHAFFAHGDWSQFDRGTLSEGELVDRAHRRSGIPRAELARLMDAVRAALTAKAETVALLRALEARAVPLFCLSNMPLEMWQHLRVAHSFWDAFHGIVISGEVRMMKPEAAVFEHLLERYGLTAAETTLIDDLPANIDGARAVGLDAILFTDAAACRAELAARRLLPD